MNRTILIVEDSEEDYQTVNRLLGRLLERPIARCSDAYSAIDYLQSISGDANSRSDNWPAVILLDLNLPGEDGRMLLKRLKADERFCPIPVVILSTSCNPQDLRFCYEQGAAGYIVKPVDLAKLRSSMEQLAAYWLQAVKLPPLGAVS